ncbi:ABC transporter ATP-binding protein [Plantibacter flavus]|uniref:ABC transporter ATP-binding protein n=1 Tax=Plantibacter flavus TaxID=150123 RepID=UPI003F13E739
MTDPQPLGAPDSGSVPILELEDVGFRYRSGTAALEGVSLTIRTGEAVGIVGESGAGKSTLLRLLLGLDRPTIGAVRFDGSPLDGRDRRRVRRFRASVQAVFQDPYSSLDPRQRIDRIVGEPLRSLGLEDASGAARRATAALEAVGLPQDAGRRYPHEFSGGQRQRIAIARAIVSNPRLLLADEPVSALDMTTRIQVIDLLAELREQYGLALVLVSHDLGTVAALCERTLVLQGGRVVEAGDTAQILHDPREPYTRRLISSIPRLPR